MAEVVSVQIETLRAEVERLNTAWKAIDRANESLREQLGTLRGLLRTDLINRMCDYASGGCVVDRHLIAKAEDTLRSISNERDDLRQRLAAAEAEIKRLQTTPYNSGDDDGRNHFEIEAAKGGRDGAE